MASARVAAAGTMAADWVTSGAAFQFASPGWDAFTLQALPAVPVTVTVLPEAAQPDTPVKPTARPDVAVALTVNVEP